MRRSQFLGRKPVRAARLWIEPETTLLIVHTSDVHTELMLAAIRAAVAAESALWHRARAGLVTPLVVSQRLLVVTLLLVAVKEAAAGDAPARPFRVFTPASMRAVLVALVLPNFVFALLDRLLGADAWECLGPLTTKPLMEQERERASSFVRYPMNAHSSHAHCAAGAYILARGLDARAPLASALLGASTVAMGLASFVWWSSKRLAAQRLDNFLMEVYTAAMGLVGLALVDPRFERHRVSAAVALIVLRGLAFPGHARLGASLAASTFGCVYAVLQLRGAGSPWWHLAGIVLSSQSLVLKMVDTNGFGAWGTAGFHYVAAAAGPVLWIWLQTLPASLEP